MKTLYTSHVHVKSGRDGGARSSDGMLDVRLAWPKELGGAGDAANPEQLFAAGFAACFASSVKGAAKTLGVHVASVNVQAEASLAAREDGSYIIAEVNLLVEAEGLAEHATSVLAEAERICAYTNATRGNTKVNVRVA